MGNIFDCCYKKKDIEEPFIKIVGIYDDKNQLTRISDIIESKTPEWHNDQFEQMRYNDMFNEAKALRNKLRTKRIDEVKEIENYGQCY